jgi:hypothetical protein
MIAIVSHDAGGAEILSCWLIEQKEPYCLVLEGPAIHIFERNVGNIEITDLNEAISKSDWVLCGTSWQSSLEKKAIRISQNTGKKVVAFLDHWVNYEERFIDNAELLLPNEIWVGDPYAEDMANEIFKETKVILKENPFFKKIKKEFVTGINASIKDSVTILYLCEPVSEHAQSQYNNDQYFGYTEKEALMFFLDNLDIIHSSISKIIIRPHPSENPNKYNWALDLSDKIFISSQSLMEEIREASILVGCETMALVVGILAGKRVISNITPGGGVCRLPHKEVESLQNLIEIKS